MLTIDFHRMDQKEKKNTETFMFHRRKLVVQFWKDMRLRVND